MTRCIFFFWGLGPLFFLVVAGCHENRSIEPDAGTSATSAVPPPPPEACPLPSNNLLSQDKLQDAARNLAARKLAAPRLLALGRALDVPCTPAQPGYLPSVASQIARFQRRTLSFTHEADGKLDDRTQRFFAMIHPSLRDEGHRCRGIQGRSLSRSLSYGQVDEAMGRNGPRASRSEGWVRELQRSLGVTLTGELDRETTQQLAGWQRIVRVVQPAVGVHGVLDGPTLDALQRAFPRLLKQDPKETDPEGFLPACVVVWQQASDQQRRFMESVYEVQRVWSAQRRSFVGIVEDATPIEAGSTAGEKAARAAKSMLHAARGSEANPKHRGTLQVVFGYRSAPMQVVLWEYHFPDRYEVTSGRRSTLPGGPHGDAAVFEMATYYAARTASPGYSLHSRGLALDLACVTPEGRKIGPTGRFLAAWRSCWCFSWLRDHAREFGFHQNPRINEPWHWEYRDPSTVPDE